MVNIVIATTVSCFEMELDQEGVSFWGDVWNLATDVNRWHKWHGPHKPRNLIGFYRGMWMSPVLFVVLKVRLEYH